MSAIEKPLKRKIAIIGGGPAAMICACHLDPDKYEVTIYEKGKRLGSKFLVAGKGGFNLTHSENLELLLSRYDAPDYLLEAIRFFDHEGVRLWMAEIGISTYVGTSRRVFPTKGIKPIEVLDAIEKVLHSRNITIKTGHKWKGVIDDSLQIENDEGLEQINADHVVFALGGSSWKKTGSDGLWTTYFESHGIDIIPFTPANCALGLNWSKKFIDRNAGKPIKNISVSYQKMMYKGEMLCTDFGIEGSPAYAVSNQIAKDLKNDKECIIHIDLKPPFTEKKINQILTENENQNISQILKSKLRLSSTAVDLIKEITTKEEFKNAVRLSALIKKLPLKIIGIEEIDKAISTSGGIARHEIDEHFELKKMPGHYAIGEMVDWSAPTGGYLLQACFSMGADVADRINKIVLN